MDKKQEQTICLRPHHLLCILTYQGEGYSPKFTENFDILIQRINAGIITHVRLIDGPDDICAPRLCDSNDTSCHCNDASVTKRDAIALDTFRNKIDGFDNIKTGDVFPCPPSLWSGLRKYFQSGTIRAACTGCEWSDLCGTAAHKDNFRNSRLK